MTLPCLYDIRACLACSRPDFPTNRVLPSQNVRIHVQITPLPYCCRRALCSYWATLYNLEATHSQRSGSRQKFGGKKSSLNFLKPPCAQRFALSMFLTSDPLCQPHGERGPSMCLDHTESLEVPCFPVVRPTWRQEYSPVLEVPKFDRRL